MLFYNRILIYLIVSINLLEKSYVYGLLYLFEYFLVFYSTLFTDKRVCLTVSEAGGAWQGYKLSARTLLCYGAKVTDLVRGDRPPDPLHRNLALSDGAVPWLPVSLPPVLGSATHARTADPCARRPR